MSSGHYCGSCGTFSHNSTALQWTSRCSGGVDRRAYESISAKVVATVSSMLALALQEASARLDYYSEELLAQAYL
jgi:hypothetical protein